MSTSAPSASTARSRVVVVAALLDRDGRILVSRRRADQAMPLKWEFPGGKVEPGESPAAALVREVREELGCEVEVARIEEVVFYPYADFDLLMLVYRCRLTAGVPTAVAVEEVAWVTPAQLPRLDLLPADFPLAQRLAADAEAAAAGPANERDEPEAPAPEQQFPPRR